MTTTTTTGNFDWLSDLFGVGEGRLGWDDLNGVLTDLGGVLDGTSSAGKVGQLLGMGGVGWLADKLFSTNPKDLPGYQGKIPKYTASRQQYATPPSRRPPAPGSVPDPAVLNYLRQPGISDMQLAQGMMDYGVPVSQVAGLTGQTEAAMDTRFRNAVGPNHTLPRRPGQGGITYFSPTQYTYAGFEPDVSNKFLPVATPPTTTTADNMAAGGRVEGGLASLAGSRFVRGGGDGTSDSVPVHMSDGGQGRLADGEFVLDARTVSEIGNGSSEAGAKRLQALVDRIHSQRATAQRGKPSKAAPLTEKLA